MKRFEVTIDELGSIIAAVLKSANLSHNFADAIMRGDRLPGLTAKERNEVANQSREDGRRLERLARKLASTEREKAGC